MSRAHRPSVRWPLGIPAWFAAIGLALADPVTREPSVLPGLGGWSLERFGADVTVLRTGAPPATRGDPSLILACAGSDRRLTLTLPPAARTRLVEARSAKVLFRPLGPGALAHPPVVAQGALSAAHALVLQETGSAAAGPIVAFVRLLLAKPAEIDVLLHPGTGLIGLRQLTAVRLSLSSKPGDADAFRDFVSACTDARGTR